MPHSEERIRKMLPKAYLRKHVAGEIYVALAHFSHLAPVLDKYVYKDGTTKTLMSLTGTIPVLFSKRLYNIPVCLWLEESYPQTPPICYVTPTREMNVLTGKFVSSDGEVTLPYLNEWNHRQCDLVSLLQVMVVTFAESPPLCMQTFPEPEQQGSCCVQFHRLVGVFAKADGRLYLNIPAEDGLQFQQEHETNC